MRKGGERALANRMWCLSRVRRRCRRVRGRVVIEACRDRRLRLSMAHRTATRCGRGMRRIRWILLAGMGGHWALRDILGKRILSRRGVRRHVQGRCAFALEAQRAGGRAVLLRWRRILRSGLMRGVVGEGGRRSVCAGRRREGLRLRLSMRDGRRALRMLGGSRLRRRVCVVKNR